MRAVQLSAGEHTRAARLKDPLLRGRFLARCDFLRRVLGHVTARDPSALEFVAGPCGKPQLAGAYGTRATGDFRLDFNLSHSENVLGLAVAFGRNVGLDVEVVQPDAGVLDVARTQFPRAEHNVILRSPPDEAMIDFYRFWTRREALAKADGRGIAAWPLTEILADERDSMSSFELIFGGKQVVGTLVMGRATLSSRQTESGTTSEEAWNMARASPPMSHQASLPFGPSTSSAMLSWFSGGAPVDFATLPIARES